MTTFPPTNWDLYGLSLGPSTAFLAFFPIIAAGLAYYSSKKRVRFACGLQIFLIPFFVVATLPSYSKIHSATTDPYYPLDFALLVATSVILLIGTNISAKRIRQQGRMDTLQWEGFIWSICVLVVVGIMIPHDRREPWSRRTHCRNNLKQIGLAMHNYHDLFRAFPVAQQGGVSWRVTMLQFIEEKRLFAQFDPMLAWNEGTNNSLTQQQVAAYDCPSRPNVSRYNESDQFLTAYQLPVGPDAVFTGEDSPTRIRDIIDGSSNTVLVLEAHQTSVVWTEPRDIEVTRTDPTVNSTNSVASSWHSGGAQATFADGSVQFLSNNIDKDVLRALLTRNGEEAVNQF